MTDPSRPAGDAMSPAPHEVARSRPGGKDQRRDTTPERALAGERARHASPEARIEDLLRRLDAAEHQVHALTQRLEAMARHHATLGDDMEGLLAAISSILIVVDAEGRVTRWNRGASDAFGIPAGQAFNQRLVECPVSWDLALLKDAICKSGGRASVRIDGLPYRGLDGSRRLLDATLHWLGDAQASRRGFILLASDITEKSLLAAQLQQAQKLEAIGQLAAGVAHEINTPTQFVGDNLRFLKEAWASLQPLLALCREDTVRGNGRPSSPAADALAAAADAAELPYLDDEVPKAIDQSLEGVEQVSLIVRAMREFSHAEGTNKVPTDLNRTIETALAVTRSEWKHAAEVLARLDASLPPVTCVPGQINQVILVLLVNAVDAIRERGAEPGRITVETAHQDGWAEIRITDTGAGIPEPIRSRVFDPFFTTKEVGRGTGQGLALAHGVVVKQHQGQIWFDSVVDSGTTFHVRLPIAGGS